MSSLVRFFAAVASVLVCVGIAATPALADDAQSGSDSQLLDVSKQVSSIQKQMADLLARGRWARSGKLMAAADCGYGEPAQVFLPWGDASSYALAPGGDLSSSDGWTMSKGAAVTDGGDPFTGAGHSLQMTNGAQAATPAMCVNLDNPTIRFFSRDVGGNGKSNLKVDILYEDLDGHVKHVTVARVKAGSDWQPSLIVPIYMNVLALASPDDVTAVAFQFKAEGLQKGEALSVSSLYVDPFHSR